nr:hypothetical protein [Candidatus Sigynarchaeota archaeon]
DKARIEAHFKSAAVKVLDTDALDVLTGKRRQAAQSPGIGTGQQMFRLRDLIKGLEDSSLNDIDHDIGHERDDDDEEEYPSGDDELGDEGAEKHGRRRKTR